jgi:ubiquinol-cytochrome c reductase cytochrome b subunit
VLGYCGARPADATVAGIPVVWVARLATVYYFALFWLIMPIVDLIEIPAKLPTGISEESLGEPVPIGGAPGLEERTTNRSRSEVFQSH